MENNFWKKYDKDIESQIYEIRLKNNLFDPEFVQKIFKKKYNWNFVISMPPPNVTGVLHIWHSLFITIQDYMIRLARMQWKKSIRIPWTDHAWISTQVVVEKNTKKLENKSRHDYWREKFIQKIWEWVKFSRSTIINQIIVMWSSCDWKREQFTMSEKLSRAVRKSFSILYSKWKIYKDTYIVNRCTNDKTVLSDIEVIYEEKQKKLYYLRYFIEWKWSFITIATSRPETIFADVAVAVNPKDRRYSKLIWKKVLIPIVNRAIPIIWDESVLMNFWSWALKITPTHDQVDFEIWKKHNLPMDKFAIDFDWKMTNLCWEFEWKKIEDIFENIIQYLDEIWNIEKIENYKTTIPYCERCWTQIQPMVSNQWFLDVKESAKKTKNLIESNENSIIPDRFKKNLYSFIDNIRPWCISRQLRWGHRIPVRKCKDWHINIFDEENVLFEKNEKKYFILSMIIFNLIWDSRLNSILNIDQLMKLLTSESLTPNEWLIYQQYLNIYKIKFLKEKNILKEIEQLKKFFKKNLKYSLEDKIFIDEINEILENSSNIEKIDNLNFKFIYKCQTCWQKKLNQDEDVLDTWYSSWLWPFSILWWPENTIDLDSYFPNQVMETWHDIIFFRVARMYFMAYEIFDKSPFENVYLHWLVRDENWEKMSKSIWNIVNPLDLIDQYGADSLRLSLINWVTPWNDTKFSQKKIDYSRKFLNKLWNASRYIYTKIYENSKDINIDYDFLREDISKNILKVNDFDIRILNKLNQLIEDANRLNSKFLFWEFTQILINFIWHDFCDWYIEINKIEKSDYSDKILIYVLWSSLKLLHPMCPFITEKLWNMLWFNWFLIISDYPQTLKIWKINSKINLMMDVIVEIRNLRNINNVKPHEKIDIIIEWNSTFLELCKKYYNFISILLKSEKIELIKNISNNFEWYITSLIFDIKVWIKSNIIENPLEKLRKLEQELKDKEEYLQNIRTLLSNNNFLSNANKEVIKQKNQKATEIKTVIISLEHEIKKIKMSLKK